MNIESEYTSKLIFEYFKFQSFHLLQLKISKVYGKKCNLANLLARIHDLKLTSSVIV